MINFNKEVPKSKLKKEGIAVSEKSTLSVNAHVKFLGADLLGVFESDTTEEGDGATKKTTVGTKLLVMPTEAENDGIRLTKVVGDINTLIKTFSTTPDSTSSLSEEEVKAKMKQFGLTAFEDITINLRQVFLYQDNIKTTVGTGAPSVTKSMEYAINIEVTNVLNLPDDFKLFNIESIGLAVWNTNRKKIKDRMNIASIESLLAEK